MQTTYIRIYIYITIQRSDADTDVLILKIQNSKTFPRYYEQTSNILALHDITLVSNTLHK